MPSRSASSSSSRPYFRNNTPSPWRRASANGAVPGTKMPSDREADAGLRLARVLLRGMTRGDVADLVAEHAGQLRLVVQIRQDAARDVDVAARQREGVDRGAVDNGERPRQVGPVRQRARRWPMSET